MFKPWIPWPLPSREHRTVPQCARSPWLQGLARRTLFPKRMRDPEPLPAAGLVGVWMGDPCILGRVFQATRGAFRRPAPPHSRLPMPHVPCVLGCFLDPDLLLVFLLSPPPHLLATVATFHHAPSSSPSRRTTTPPLLISLACTDNCRNYGQHHDADIDTDTDIDTNETQN